VAKFERLDKKLQIIYCNLLCDSAQFKDFFTYIDFKKEEHNLAKTIGKFFAGKICEEADLEKLIKGSPVELAYAIAQIDVLLEDNASITPPWVLKAFPRVENILQILKGRNCGICSYCKHSLDIHRAFKRWFGHSAFRTYDGEPLQEIAVQKAVDGESLLVVFPTGGGKSIAFQLPAFMQGENERGLTVVISPLQSLQKDQVDNLESKHNITAAVRLDGSLDPIERSKSIERAEGGGNENVKLASLLYISPESLRSKSIERLLIKRNVVRFVIDEAHCFSAWGQDFRTDYLYIAEFIKNLQEIKGNNRRIPVSCFTATAKQEVVADIIKYFEDNLNLKLATVVSNSARKNLAYHAVHVKDDAEKMQKLRDLLSEYKCPTIIYVSFPHQATGLAKALVDIGIDAISYHGKMDKKDRIRNQDAFTKGECNIIVATKAFGMGVDKDNVGLVVHYNISTSLEDYVQEAGRAGRDAKLNAVCYALFNDEDINKHFTFLNQIKITQQEIDQIWRAIKRLTDKRRQITASPREIAIEAGWNAEKEDEIGTRVATSVNALEQARFLKRGQNMLKIYANSILAKSMTEASERIEESTVFDNDKQKEEARRVMSRLFKTRAKGGRDADENNEHIDYIADREQLDTEKVVRIVTKLREERILEDSKDLYAFLLKDAGAQAKIILETHKNTESFLCRFLEENEEELAAEKRFNKKEINSMLQEECGNASIAHLSRIMNFYDIKRLVKQTKDENKDYVLLKPYLPIAEIKEKSEKRLRIAFFIIRYLYNKIPRIIKDDSDTKVEFSVLELKDGFNHEHQMFNEEVDAIEIEDALYAAHKTNRRRCQFY
jgi:ATP-dependent DNA helicase RecQ